MKYEVVEHTGEWVVCLDGVEIARFRDQMEALTAVGDRLRDAEPGEGSVSLAVRYEART
jgi:hypothetical protein